MTTETMHPASSKASPSTQRVVLDDEAEVRLDRWFKRHYPALTHGELQKALRSGQIRLEGKKTEASARLQAGQTLRLPPWLRDKTAAAVKAEGGKKPIRNPEKLKSMVLFEDKDVVALNKPAGLAVQGGTGLKENLDDSLMVFSPDGQSRPKLVHRLDRDTSGVLMIARTPLAATRLAASFRERSTQKIYWAITCGVPERSSGRIDAPLIKKGQIMHVAQDDELEEAQSAATLYKVVEAVGKKMAFVALWPLTGRTHQLRVHLAHLGTPIWGDPLYGESASATALDDEKEAAFSGLGLGSGLHLHARRLIIPHPRKGMIDVTAPLGPQMRHTWRSLGFSDKAKVSFDDV